MVVGNLKERSVIRKSLKTAREYSLGRERERRRKRRRKRRRTRRVSTA